MSSRKGYIGIDYFKFVAAFLEIAIHTSPLTTFTENGDFILTRIIARVAVPFYFMTSGFFLISRYAYNTDKLRAFLKKMSVIYGISVLVYIPLNVKWLPSVPPLIGKKCGSNLLRFNALIAYSNISAWLKISSRML